MKSEGFYSNVHLGRRIKEVRQTNGLTQNDFADSLGIVQGFLSGVEQGKKNVSDTLLVALCLLYGINKDWLKAGKGEKFREQCGLPAVTQKASIPLLKRIPQDFQKNLDEKDISDYIAMPNGTCGSYAIFVSGDFMAPTICDGDLIIISTKEEIGNRDIILLNNRWGEAILRRYRIVGTEIFLSPDNHAYAPFQKDNKLSILGKVVEVWRKIRL